jgi:phosphofructokinase-like protein
VRIGVLTGGGDCPGLNAVLRAVVKRAEVEHGHSVIGFRRGWRGVADGDLLDLGREHVRNVLPLGGTLLGTARYHPSEQDGGIERVLETLRRERIDAMICIGGDGTLGAAHRLATHGVQMVCVPKTIDNDVAGTDRSVGFDTAVAIATEAIDRVHTTAESHNRVMVVEVMGHKAGWIAVCAGIAGGADLVLTPEEPFDIGEVCAALRHRHRSYANYSIVVVAEGAVPLEGTMEFTAPTGPFGSIVAGAIGERLKIEIAQRTGFETRVTVLGHVQRGGAPTAADRLLGSRYGVTAADAVGTAAEPVMTALRGDRIELVPVAGIAGLLKLVPAELRRAAVSLV